MRCARRPDSCGRKWPVDAGLRPRRFRPSVLRDSLAKPISPKLRSFRLFGRASPGLFSERRGDIGQLFLKPCLLPRSRLALRITVNRVPNRAALRENQVDNRGDKCRPKPTRELSTLLNRSTAWRRISQMYVSALPSHLLCRLCTTNLKHRELFDNVFQTATALSC